MRVWPKLFISLVCLISSPSFSQTTILAGSSVPDLEAASENISKASSCKWKKGPSQVNAADLSPEVLSFVGASNQGRVTQLCQGTIQCDVNGMLWQSDNYMICGMRSADCDARKCWLQYLEDRLAGSRALDKEIRTARQSPQKNQRQNPEQHADSSGGRQ